MPTARSFFFFLIFIYVCIEMYIYERRVFDCFSVHVLPPRSTRVYRAQGVLNGNFYLMETNDLSKRGRKIIIIQFTFSIFLTKYIIYYTCM